MKILIRSYLTSSVIFVVIFVFSTITFAGSFGPEKVQLPWWQKILNVFLPDKCDFKPVQSFGAVTTSGNFPQALNTFQDGDVINAGDWNNIEAALGNTTSTVTTSTNYLLRSTSSLNPGHMHNS